MRSLAACSLMSHSLTTRTEERRTARSACLGSDRSRLGQFFTPGPAADLIASMPTLPTEGKLRVLDPGVGIGSLTAALVARCAAEAPSVELCVTGVEVDSSLAEDLNATFADCATALHGNYEAVVCDFIPWAVERIKARESYDLIVMNPPYRKVTRGSDEETAFAAAKVRTTNMYAGFVTLALRLLAPGGQLVAITPRSFANGAYFSGFRQELLRTTSIRRIHVFDRRNAVFKDSDVLQENVIITLERSTTSRDVLISSSRDFTEEPTVHMVSYEAVVQPADPEKFIHISTDQAGLAVATEMSAMPARLADLGLEVSTGRVVDFRATEHLRATLGAADAPLVYPGHLVPGGCRWPEGAPRKPQAIARNSLTEWSLIPSGTYVTVRRFSAKEEPRRVVASLIQPEDLPGEVWGFENHLNVFHVKGRGMAVDAAKKLVEYLNSDMVDAYVRLFNGHTQINAGDLRNLRYPPLGSITDSDATLW
jgi:adenine-specific DNA-methyltransferase